VRRFIYRTLYADQTISASVALVDTPLFILTKLFLHQQAPAHPNNSAKEFVTRRKRLITMAVLVDHRKRIKASSSNGSNSASRQLENFMVALQPNHSLVMINISNNIQKF
jgi:hypothetical protein